MVAKVYNYFFVAARETDTIEEYDVDSDTWSVLPVVMASKGRTRPLKVGGLCSTVAKTRIGRSKLGYWAQLAGKPFFVLSTVVCRAFNLNYFLYAHRLTIY